MHRNKETETQVDPLPAYVSELDREIMLEMIEGPQALGRGFSEAFANSREEPKDGYNITTTCNRQRSNTRPF